MNQRNSNIISRLHSYQEIVGNLLEVKQNEEYFKIKFTCEKEIELPKSAIHYEQLTKLIGKRIGILNFEGNYKFRVIKSEKVL